MDATSIIGIRTNAPPQHDRVAGTLGDVFQNMLRDTGGPAVDDPAPKRDRAPGVDRRAPTAPDEPQPRERTPRAEDATPETQQNRDFEPDADDGGLAAYAEAPRDTRRDVPNERDGSVRSTGDGATKAADGVAAPNAATETGPAIAAAAASPNAPRAGQPAQAAPAGSAQTPATGAPGPAQTQVPTDKPAEAVAASAAPETRGAGIGPAARVVVTGPSPAVITNGMQTSAVGLMAQRFAQEPSGQPGARQASAEGPPAPLGTPTVTSSGSAAPAETAQRSATTPILAETATPIADPSTPSRPATTNSAPPPPVEAQPLGKTERGDAQTAAARPQNQPSGGVITGATTPRSDTHVGERTAAQTPLSQATTVSSDPLPTAGPRTTGEMAARADGQPVQGVGSEKTGGPANAQAQARPGADGAGDGNGHERSPGASAPALAQAASGDTRSGGPIKVSAPATQKASAVEAHGGTDTTVAASSARVADLPTPVAMATPPPGGTDAAALPAASGNAAPIIDGNSAVRTPTAGGPLDRSSLSQPVPIDQVAVQIRRAAGAGENRIRIRLHPAELGHIDVQLKVGTDGVVRAVIAIDRPETFDLMQRDARGLERALQDAGLKTDSGSLSFNLRGDGQGGAHGERQTQTATGGLRTPANTSTDDADPQAAGQAMTAGIGAGRLDIKV